MPGPRTLSTSCVLVMLALLVSLDTPARAAPPSVTPPPAGTPARGTGASAAATAQTTARSTAKTSADPGLVLSASSVLATGTRHVEIQVSRFGRYALSARSPQGTAVRLVDRMSGPGALHGTPGVSDGRVDVFLERGEYRIEAISDAAGTGEALIEARPFVEVGGDRPALLPDQAESASTLADLEQRSWWVQIDADEDFAVELAGRSLAEVRLWRDGQWLDPAVPTCEDITSDPARPLRRCALATRLGAGLYQLVAYGGPAMPWAVPDGDQPLHVRRGMPTLALTGRLSGTVGPFGTERWLAPGGATDFRLELPEGAPASVGVRTFDATDPYRRDGTVGRVEKESLPPAADVSVGVSREARVVTVTGAQGQPFVLQQFPATGRSIPVKGAGTFFLTTLHMGDPADRSDVTGVLAENTSGAAPLATSLVPLAGTTPYRRKFNLLGRTTISFEVAEPGEYQVAVAGVGASWRWEPLLTSIPKGYEAPPLRDGTASTQLTSGRWTLTLSPKKSGIAEVVVRRDPAQRVEPNAPRAAVSFPAVVLQGGKSYTLTLNEAAGAKPGMVLRALPLDLADPLPLTLGPNEALTLPFVANEAGTISAGAGAQVAIDGGIPAASVRVGAGEHQLTVRNLGAGTLQTAALLVPESRRKGAPLPLLPDTAITRPPELPALSANVPRGVDLARDATTTYRLDVPKAGLYRLESTGLLATAGAVRTRTRPVLASAAINGVGRNFLLQTYLREGDYQVTVGAQGASAGHLGLRLAPTALRAGGALRDGVPARATVPAGEGLSYDFEVPTAGTYTLRAFGMGRLFRVRVEDADGWPLLAPEVDGDLRLDLAPGRYRVVVLPEPADSTRITVLERVPDPVVRAGHGPFPLRLDTPERHVWWEPAHGDPREADVWTFTLAAPAETTITADSEMAGDIYRNGTADPVGRLVPGRVWTGALAAGTYRVELASARRNSGVSYAVRVTPAELVAGLSRDLSVPATVPVSVGTDGLVEIASMGVVDVRARLYDPSGAVVAASDDRPDDWNFRLAERLPPGLYTLRVDPVGVASGRTRVSMAVAAESSAPALPVGQARTYTLGVGSVSVPVQPGDSGLLTITATSTENVGIGVETQDASGWRTVGSATGTTPSVAIRLAPDHKWRVRLSSLDGRGVPTSLRADVTRPRELSLGALAGGVAVQAASGTSTAVAVVRRDGPGLLDLSTRIGVSWCPTAGEACEPLPAGVLGAPDAEVWLLAETAGGRAANLRGAAIPVGAAPVRTSVPAGRELAVDVASAAGPVLVVARSEAGQPGLRIGEGAGRGAGATGNATGAANEAANGGTTGATAIGARVAYGVALGGKAVTARILDTRTGPTRGPLDVEITRVAFPAPSVVTPSGGRAAGAVAAGAAVSARFTGRARIALGEGLVAVLTRGDVPVATVAASDGPRSVTFEAQADRVVVLNPGATAASWSLEAAAAPTSGTSGPASGSPSARLERAEVTAGWSVFPVPAADAEVLHVRGAVTSALWIGDDGRVLRGLDLPTNGAPGRLEVLHGTGAWVGWNGRATEDAGALWAGPPPAAVAPIALPATVPLSGATWSFAAKIDRDGAVRVRAGQPVIALVRRDGGHATAQFAADGVIDVRGAVGQQLQVALRPVGRAALTGNAEIEFVAAAPLDGVGGPEVVAPGSALVWAITVTRPGRVGLGVRTDSPALSARLYGPDGALLGEGLAQMPELEAGSYLLVATLPPDAAPAQVRAAAVGLHPPDTGPPPDVVRGYLVAAGVLSPDTAPAEDSQ